MTQPIELSEKLIVIDTEAQQQNQENETVYAPLDEGKAVLKVLTGPHKGATITLEKGQTAAVGASQDSDLCLEQDPKASGTHAQLRMDGNTISIQDEASTNGTYLRVQGEQQLEDGDVILVGYTQIQVSRA